MALLLRGSMVPPPPSYKFEEFKDGNSTYNERIIQRSEWKTYSGSVNSAIGKTPTYYWDYLETNYPSSDYVVLFDIDTRESVENVTYGGGIAANGTLDNKIYCYDTTLPQYTRIHFTIIKRSNPLLKYQIKNLVVESNQWWTDNTVCMFNINSAYPMNDYLLYYEPSPISQEERNYFINSYRPYPQPQVNSISFETDQAPTMDLHFFIYAIDKKSKGKKLFDVEQGIFKVDSVESDFVNATNTRRLKIGPKIYVSGDKKDYIVFYEPIIATKEQQELMHKLHLIRDKDNPNRLISSAPLTDAEGSELSLKLLNFPIAYTAIPANK